MKKRLEFYYDYISVYSYLANSQLLLLEDTEVVYRPMLLGAVMQARGNPPPLTIQAKDKYLISDVARWVDRYGVAYQWNPKFPQNTVNALRLALVAQDKGEFPALHQRLFDAIWVEQQDLSDKDALASIVASAGLAADDYMQKIGEDSVKDALKRNTEDALARGVFGAPTFFVDEQMFFGNDRFEFIGEALG